MRVKAQGGIPAFPLPLTPSRQGREDFGHGHSYLGAFQSFKPIFTMTTESRTPSQARGAFEAFSSHVINPLLDLLLPLSCAVCHREGSLLCEECEPSLPKLEQPYCSVCARPGQRGVCSHCAVETRGFDFIRAPYLFEGAVREMVHDFKYRSPDKVESECIGAVNPVSLGGERARVRVKAQGGIPAFPPPSNSLPPGEGGFLGNAERDSRSMTVESA